ncbi:MAG: PhzF family phenazine biosynthesis protein [Halosimplex sp.]
MRQPLHLVDVFARERYAGNQLAVVTDAADLADDELQAFAAEIDFSETTYVEAASPADGAWPVRIFTPEAEIPFAGHPTLGTAHEIREHLADGRPDEVVLDLDVGRVPVEVRERDGRETLWMTQQPPEFGDELAHEALAAVLGLDVDDLDGNYPVQVVSTGLPTVVVPLADRAALERIDVDRDAYDRVTGDREAKNVLAFCPDPRDDANDFAVRVFAPFYGVPEDPATGSSNGCLAAYLVRHGYRGPRADSDSEPDPDPLDVRVEQGHEMGRPSLLHLRARETDGGGDGDDEDDIAVEVGGRVEPVARGTLL